MTTIHRMVVFSCSDISSCLRLLGHGTISIIMVVLGLSAVIIIMLICCQKGHLTLLSRRNSNSLIIINSCVWCWSDYASMVAIGVLNKPTGATSWPPVTVPAAISIAWILCRRSKLSYFFRNSGSALLYDWCSYQDFNKSEMRVEKAPRAAAITAEALLFPSLVCKLPWIALTTFSAFVFFPPLHSIWISYFPLV